VVWVLNSKLFSCVYGFFIDAVGFCDDVTIILYNTTGMSHLKCDLFVTDRRKLIRVPQNVGVIYVISTGIYVISVGLVTANWR
jgi:hypothetical protein